MTKEKTTRYYRNELKKFKLKIKLLERYIQGMKDALYYIGIKK